MYLLFHEILHIILSLLSGLAVYYFLGKKSGLSRGLEIKASAIFISAFIAGVLVDADHWIDYWLFYGIDFDLARFFSTNYFRESGKIYVFFHGWEYAIIFLVLGIYWRKYGAIFYALSLSLFLHLFLDSISYGFKFLEYSIIYRILNEFRLWM